MKQSDRLQAIVKKLKPFSLEISEGFEFGGYNLCNLYYSGTGDSDFLSIEGPGFKICFHSHSDFQGGKTQKIALELKDGEINQASFKKSLSCAEEMVSKLLEKMGDRMKEIKAKKIKDMRKELKDLESDE